MVALPRLNDTLVWWVISKIFHGQLNSEHKDSERRRRESIRIGYRKSPQLPLFLHHSARFNLTMGLLI